LACAPQLTVPLTTHIALLRGINVGGHRSVGMTDLRNFLAELGFDDARSLLQSGNLVFNSKVRTGAELERFLESEAHDRLSLEVDFIVRTPDEWKSVIRQNPFRKEAERDPGHLVVMFLKSAPDVNDIVALEAEIRGPEVVRAKGKQPSVAILYNKLARLPRHVGELPGDFHPRSAYSA